MRILFFHILFFAAVTFPFAQNQNSFIVGASYIKSGEVLLRWAPTQYDLLLQGNKFGYKIERAEGNDTTAFLNGTSVVIKNELKAFAKNDSAWNELSDLGMNAEIIHAALYTPMSVNATAKKFALSYALITCDLYSDVAKAAGLFYSDKNIDPSKKYIYKISIASTTVKYKPANIIADAGKLSMSPANETLHTNRGIKRVTLLWNTENFTTYYSAYIVERSDDSINYLRINKTPLLPVTTNNDPVREISFKDSIKLDKKYFYRIKGINPFGEFGSPSNVVSVKSKKYFSFPLIDSTIQTRDDHARVSWKMSSDVEVSYIKGFVIMRAKKAETDYQLITKFLLAPTEKSFTDATPNISNYYKIGVVSMDDDTLFSYEALIKMVDNTPPAIPESLNATVDTNGIVKLNWKNNTESDLRGYRVYRTNDLKEEFYERTKTILKGLKFTDTISLNTLTSQVYYAVSAVDSNFNNSALSIPLRLKRPDKIKPVSCIITDLKQTDSTVVVEWIESTSTDVMNYALWRSENKFPAEMITQWGSKEIKNNFIDTNIIHDHHYAYSLVVVDSSNNRSTSPYREIIFKPGVRPAIKQFSGNLNVTTRSIQLTWTTGFSDVQNFVIYKSIKEAPMRIYATVQGNERLYIDAKIKPSNTYVYLIKTVFKDGSESKISKMLEVTY